MLWKYYQLSGIIIYYNILISLVILKLTLTVKANLVFLVAFDFWTLTSTNTILEPFSLIQWIQKYFWTCFSHSIENKQHDSKNHLRGHCDIKLHLLLPPPQKKRKEKLAPQVINTINLLKEFVSKWSTSDWADIGWNAEWLFFYVFASALAGAGGSLCFKTVHTATICWFSAFTVLNISVQSSVRTICVWAYFSWNGFSLKTRYWIFSQRLSKVVCDSFAV